MDICNTLPTNQTLSKINYLITMLLPYIYIILLLLFFCYNYFVNNMHMHLVFTFILHTDYSNINFQPQGWNAPRVTLDKITTTHSVFLRFSSSSFTNRTYCSLAATILLHTTMSFHLFFTPTILLINTIQPYHQIQRLCRSMNYLYFIFYIQV